MHAATVRRSHRQHAFTLIELLIALAVVAILAAALFPVIAQARDHRKVNGLSNARQLSEASSLYALDHAGMVTRAVANLLPYAKGAKTLDVSDCPTVYSIRPMTSGGLLYHGGNVETAPAVYLVFWGKQWVYNDPSGEAALLKKFFNHVGGTGWSKTNTQYYETGPIYAGNQTRELKGSWYDKATNAPSSPAWSDLANEAVKAAAHFGSAGNPNAQYFICTATGNNASGFGTSYCAWHSYTGSISFTNMPYITDAGGSCGANFNGLGANAGITIVAGHEYAETVTDPYLNSWYDSGGSEIGDLCAWAPNTSNVSMHSVLFPVQPLWSNTSGSCVLFGP